PPTTRVAGGVLGTSLDVQDAPTVGRHYWQVVAKASGCPAPTASPISTLDVSCTGAPLPSRPADGAARPGGSITFEWAPAAGASSYDVYLDGSSPPTTRVARDVLGTTLEVPDLPAGRHYYWQVVANGAGCPASSQGPVVAFDTCGAS